MSDSSALGDAGRGAATPDVSDEALLDRVRAGDLDAYGTLWSRHSRAAAAAAASVGRHSDVDDLVAESYLRVLTALQRGGGPRSAFRPYLYRTIASLAATWGTRQREFPSENLDELLDADADGAYNPTEASRVRNFELATAASAFASLPEEWQTVLWYTELEGLPPAKAAPHLGLSARATAVKSSRARQRLRQAWVRAHLSSAERPADCADAIDRFDGLRRGTLHPNTAARVEGHLSTCETCASGYDEFRHLSSRLRIAVFPLLFGAGIAASFLRDGLSAPGAAAAGFGTGGLGAAGSAGAAGSPSGSAGSTGGSSGASAGAAGAAGLSGVGLAAVAAVGVGILTVVGLAVGGVFAQAPQPSAEAPAHSAETDSGAEQQEHADAGPGPGTAGTPGKRSDARERDSALRAEQGKQPRPEPSPVQIIPPIPVPEGTPEEESPRTPSPNPGRPSPNPGRPAPEPSSPPTPEPPSPQPPEPRPRPEPTPEPTLEPTPEPTPTPTPTPKPAPAAPAVDAPGYLPDTGRLWLSGSGADPLAKIEVWGERSATPDASCGEGDPGEPARLLRTATVSPSGAWLCEPITDITPIGLTLRVRQVALDPAGLASPWTTAVADASFAPSVANAEGSLDLKGVRWTAVGIPGAKWELRTHRDELITGVFGPDGLASVRVPLTSLPTPGGPKWSLPLSFGYAPVGAVSPAVFLELPILW